MTKYASNKYAMGISDRSGAAYRQRDMRKEWTGMLVGKDEWEAKQPQLMVLKTHSDPQAIKDPRPDRVEPSVEVLLPRRRKLQLARADLQDILHNSHWRCEREIATASLLGRRWS